MKVDLNGDDDFSDPGDIATLVLSEGDSYLVDGGVNLGAHVVSFDPANPGNAGNPVQVIIFAGDQGSNYETRDSSLLPHHLLGHQLLHPGVDRLLGYMDRLRHADATDCCVALQSEWGVHYGEQGIARPCGCDLNRLGHRSRERIRQGSACGECCVSLLLGFRFLWFFLHGREHNANCRRLWRNTIQPGLGLGFQPYP